MFHCEEDCDSKHGFTKFMDDEFRGEKKGGTMEMLKGRDFTFLLLCKDKNTKKATLYQRKVQFNVISDLKTGEYKKFHSNTDMEDVKDREDAIKHNYMFRNNLSNGRSPRVAYQRVALDNEIMPKKICMTPKEV